MITYQLTADVSCIKKIDEEGGVRFVPNDPTNSDWAAYQEWLAIDGNEPEPAE